MYTTDPVSARRDKLTRSLQSGAQKLPPPTLIHFRSQFLELQAFASSSITVSGQLSVRPQRVRVFIPADKTQTLVEVLITLLETDVAQ